MRKFSKIAENLILWYTKHKRNLPWRNINNPYNIWLSEIILQQTQIKQGLPYYLKFAEKYPDVFHLASSTEEEVLRDWQGLGYYSRARNMLRCAKVVVNDHGGKFPEEYDELKKLPGIGPYTAAAIASFAFKKPIPVVDGNVYRFISRLFGIEKDIGDSDAFRFFQKILKDLIPEKQPDVFNQAIMEFGSKHCKPANPDCITCPFSSQCIALNNSDPANFPVKKRKTKKTIRNFHYLMFYNEDGCWMKRRGNNDIWAGLYEFLWIDSQNNGPDWKEVPPVVAGGMAAEPSEPLKHLLSHQQLNIMVWKIYNVGDSDFQELKHHSWEEVSNKPKPVVITKFLEKQRFI